MSGSDTSIHTGGGAFNAVGSAIGGSHNRVQATVGNVTVASTVTGAGLDELVPLFEQIRAALENAPDLDEQQRSDLREDLDAAHSAVERDEPAPARAKSRLESMAQILDSAAPVAASAVTIGRLVAQALGVVARFVI